MHQGQLSDDGRSYWNGHEWQSALSADGHYYWNGQQWIPLYAAPPPRPPLAAEAPAVPPPRLAARPPAPPPKVRKRLSGGAIVGIVMVCFAAVGVVGVIAVFAALGSSGTTTATPTPSVTTDDSYEVRSDVTVTPGHKSNPLLLSTFVRATNSTNTRCDYSITLTAGGEEGSAWIKRVAPGQSGDELVTLYGDMPATTRIDIKSVRRTCDLK